MLDFVTRRGSHVHADARGMFSRPVGKGGALALSLMSGAGVSRGGVRAATAECGARRGRGLGEVLEGGLHVSAMEPSAKKDTVTPSSWERR